MRKLVAFAGVALVSVAVAGTALANHSWGTYHWARSSNPFTVKLGDNVGGGWDSYLSEASSDWSASSVLDTTVVGGNGSNCSPTSGRVEVCNGLYGNTGWLGIARIWTTRGAHIAQGVVQVNDTYFGDPSYNTTGWKSLVMCQEVGHTLGLAHQDEDFNNAPITPHTCMDYFVPDANESVGPNQHDYDQLVKIYSHLDRFTTLSAAAPDADLPGNAPPFSQASRANGSVYIDDLGNGERLITHVFWTPFGE